MGRYEASRREVMKGEAMSKFVQWECTFWNWTLDKNGHLIAKVCSFLVNEFVTKLIKYHTFYST